MKDNVAIFLACLILIVCLGWFVMRANGINPVVRAADDTPASPPVAAVNVEPRPVETNIETTLTQEPPAAAHALAGRIEPTLAVVIRPAAPPIPTAPAPFPGFPQIKPGSDRSQITELFGDPALSATTEDHGHLFDTFVYNRNRSDALTIIRFTDGRVASAKVAP